MSSLARKLGRPATMADLEALPPHLKGEIIDGELYVQARPRPRHSRVLAMVVDGLHGAYDSGNGGPGGWWILPEPGIELPGSPEFSPDAAGCRHERLPELPADEPIRIAPDWICEILSPTTRGYDFLVKRPFYAKIGVSWLWYVDIEAKTVTVSRLEASRWVEVQVAGEDATVRLEPFEAVELDLSEWWRASAR